MNKLIVTFLSLIIGQQAFANVFEHPASLESVSKEIPQFESITCRFKQAKTLPQGGITLYSSGDFKYEKNKGVTFYTTSPVKSTVSYTSKDYKQINNVINAIANKSYSGLEKDFNFFYSDGILGLIPKNEVKNYLKSIEIKTDKKMITKMTIIAADFTKTVIWFQ